MNTIIKPFLDEHRNLYQLKDDDSKVFEHLFNYIATRNYTSRHFDPSELSLGQGEVGIDGVAIIVNDTLITEFPQIEALFKQDIDLSVTFIFTQSKTSESFDSHAMNQFFVSVYDFVTEGKLNKTQNAIELHKICKYILANPIKLSKNPDIHMFFSYTGKSNTDDTRETIIKQHIDKLKSTSLFDEVTFNLYDINKLVNACRAIKSKIKKSIDMIDCAIIPRIEKIEEAYIAVVKCSDFINLITNEDGAILSNLFEDNVRYFLGRNTINAEIQSTLISDQTRIQFPVLNNGVTIVAHEVRRVGNNITLTDFQVINGCQTSFVLYENRKKLSNDVTMTIKIISTEDKTITDAIVRSTNRQTPILNEAFETLRDLHKNLELAYASYDAEHKLYYERRSKQYDSQQINRNKIISFPYQTTAYVAIFLGEPHSTHRYYGELLHAYSRKIYKDDDILDQYCMASLYAYTVEEFLRHHAELAAYKKFRFHIAFLLRCMAVSIDVPNTNSKEMKKYCSLLYDKIKDARWVSNNIQNICKIIDKVSSTKKLSEKDGNDLSRIKEFTTQLVEEMGLQKSKTSKKDSADIERGTKVKCKVISWNSSFAYVELVDYKETGSIHVKHISPSWVEDIGEILSIGQEIEATVLDKTQHPIYGYALSLLQDPFSLV